MKKMFLAAFLAAFLFVACGGSSSDNNNSTDNDSNQTNPDNQIQPDGDTEGQPDGDTPSLTDEDTASNVVCGNGKVETGETCDGGKMACSEISSVYTGGEATCATDCKSFSTLNCTSPEDDKDIVIPEKCGNSTLDAGEKCDGTAVACSTLGDYTEGNAVCKKDCSDYIMTDCKKVVAETDDDAQIKPDEDAKPTLCGNGNLDSGETCEKDDTKPCTELGNFTSGTATCMVTCLGWNASSCKLSESVKLYPVKVGGKWGYIDPSGNVIIDPATHDFNRAALYYHGGLAPVQNTEYKWGFIDSQGNYVIDSKYDMVGGFTPDGFCNVGDMGDPNTIEDDYWTYIDKTGSESVLGGKSYDMADPFYEGLAAVTKNDLVGFMNTKGEMVINYKYKEALSFVGGICPVKDPSTSKWFYIDSKDNKLFGKEWDMAKEFNEGVAIVAKKVGSQDGQPVYKYQYIDVNGNLLFAGKEFDGAVMFSEGLAGVREVNKWSYIDIEGKVVVSPPSSVSLVFFSYFQNGFATVADSTTGMYGFINMKGEIAIPLTYDLATPFFGELAQIIVKGDKTLYGFINQQGVVVWEPQN